MASLLLLFVFLRRLLLIKEDTVRNVALDLRNTLSVDFVNDFYLDLREVWLSCLVTSTHLKIHLILRLKEILLWKVTACRWVKGFSSNFLYNVLVKIEIHCNCHLRRCRLMITLKHLRPNELLLSSIKLVLVRNLTPFF